MRNSCETTARNSSFDRFAARSASSDRRNSSAVRSAPARALACVIVIENSSSDNTMPTMTTAVVAVRRAVPMNDVPARSRSIHVSPATSIGFDTS